MTLDNLDRAILRLLEADARISFADLAEQVGLSKTPCWKRVKALEESGVIRGYTTRIDAAALGFGIEALVQVSVRAEAHEAFEAAVRQHPLIRRCHATTGEADYVLNILATDMTALDALLRREIGGMPGVRRTVTAMVTREIKGNTSVVAVVREGKGP